MESPIDRVVPLETSNFCPRVTVFVPVYNAEKFIADTVASVLRQTFTDFELLVIDDGSTDQSIKILESFHDQRIRIERNGKNRGRPFTRNKGLMQARGEYLSVLDSDDLCEPDRLARQVEFLDTHPNIAAVGSWAKYVDENGNVAFICKPPAESDEIRRKIFQANCFIHSSVTFRRQALIEIGGYNLEYLQAQDYELFLRLSARHDLANISEPLVQYRVHPDQVSLRKLASQRRFADRARVAAYEHQRSLKLILPNTAIPRTNMWDRLRGKPHTVGGDYINWIDTYRSFGRENLTRPLILRSLLIAPLSARAWRETRRLVGMTIIPPSLRNTLRWYRRKAITLLGGGKDK